MPVKKKLKILSSSFSSLTRRVFAPAILKECLLLQLQRQLREGKDVALAIQVLDKYFDEFTKKHYEKIQRGLSLSDEDLKEVIGTIIRLNPKPGGNVGEINKAESYVVPDFFIINNNGKLELTLNSRNAPDLRISEGYRDMLKEYDRGSKKDKRQKRSCFIHQTKNRFCQVVYRYDKAAAAYFIKHYECDYELSKRFFPYR